MPTEVLIPIISGAFAVVMGILKYLTDRLNRLEKRLEKAEADIDREQRKSAHLAVIVERLGIHYENIRLRLRMIAIELRGGASFTPAQIDEMDTPPPLHAILKRPSQ